MRTETSEALARLVGCFVAAIEDTGTQIPSDIVEHLTENPLKSCEALNDLALSCGAIDDSLDAALAAIYESMDATDARGEVDEFTAERIARTWVRTHREPEPEPEPAPEPEPEPEPKPEAYEGHGSAANEQEMPAEETPPLKKKRRNRKQKVDEAAESNIAEASDQEAAPEPAPTPEPAPVEDATEKSVPEKPKRRRARKAEKPAAEATEPVAPVEDAAPAAAGEDTQSEETAPTTEATPVANDEPAAATDAQPEPAAAPAPSGETLSVDQAVAILGVSRPTIYKLIESGELPASKKGRSWRISAAAVSERANQ